MKIIRLITCDTSIEAHILKGRLESEGISCFLTNENFSNLMPHYNRIFGSGTQVMVDESDFEKASQILDLNVKRELICPNCNSTNIKIGLGKNKFYLLFFLIISIFSGILFNNINNVYCCKDCGTEFK